MTEGHFRFIRWENLKVFFFSLIMNNFGVSPNLKNGTRTIYIELLIRVNIFVYKEPCGNSKYSSKKKT